MRDSKSRPGRKVWSLLSSVAACLASGSALAQVITTSAVPVSQFFVVWPIDVCTNAGTSCAYVNNQLQTVLSSTGTSTIVGFNDPATGMNSMRNIWSQLGIDVKFNPLVQYNSTASQTLKVDSCGTTLCMSSQLLTLTQHATPTPPATTPCPIYTMTNPPTPRACLCFR